MNRNNLNYLMSFKSLNEFNCINANIGIDIMHVISHGNEKKNVKFEI